MTTSRAVRSIATVIVNYRTADLIIANADALLGEYRDFPGSRLYIVDNASPGDDARELAAFADREDRRSMVRVIASATNGGFGAGNNIALREILTSPAPPDYILLLNPDAWPRPGALGALARRLDANPKAGVVGPRLEGEDGRVQVSAFRFHSIASEFEMMARTGVISKILAERQVFPEPKGEPGRWDWVSGAAALFRRELFEDTGLFDEEFFLYFEETDLMFRARRKGWEVWYEPAATFVHIGGASSRRNALLPDAAPAPDYWRDSRSRYFRKHHGPVFAFAADVAWLAGSLFFLLRRAAAGSDTSAVRHDIARFWRSQFGSAKRAIAPTRTRS